MFFQILSHASLLVRSNNKTLLTDPWLIGSCYWRSWWNFPPVKSELVDKLEPDFIYITHVHWDHFHGPSLKRFSRQTPIIIPLERSRRSKRDLADMGFTNVIEVRHARSVVLQDDFTITSYQFSHWGDSALVIEADGVTLLNANDAKFMGLPLRQILSNHKRVDFAFRSHSSANDRICYHYTDEGSNGAADDRMLYARSFVNFMERVKPRYAVPFASNHCYLHRDTYGLNSVIETPADVEQYLHSVGGFSASELKVMVSGDSWDSKNGFDIKKSTWFSKRETHLQQYLEEEGTTLRATYALEEKTRLRLDEVETFFRRVFEVVPGIFKASFREKPIILCATYGGGTDYFKLDLYLNQVSKIAEGDLAPDSLQFETTALVLREAMASNMFSHIGISKRVIYRSRRQDARHIRKFNELLAAYEYEVLPLRLLFSFHTLKVYMRRWREVVLYAQLIAGLLAGKSIHQLEEKQLGRAESLRCTS
jgi:UDP-MurNAc hydroxylase